MSRVLQQIDKLLSVIGGLYSFSSLLSRVILALCQDKQQVDVVIPQKTNAIDM